MRRTKITDEAVLEFLLDEKLIVEKDPNILGYSYEVAIDESTFSHLTKQNLIDQISKRFDTSNGTARRLLFSCQEEYRIRIFSLEELSQEKIVHGKKWNDLNIEVYRRYGIDGLELPFNRRLYTNWKNLYRKYGYERAIAAYAQYLSRVLESVKRGIDLKKTDFRTGKFYRHDLDRDLKSLSSALEQLQSSDRSQSSELLDSCSISKLVPLSQRSTLHDVQIDLLDSIL